MRHRTTTRYAILLSLAILATSSFLGIVRAPVITSYYLTPVPFFTQEGYSVTFVLTVIGAIPSTTYQFVFLVKDPSGKTWTSTTQTHNTTSSETQFSILLIFPSTSFAGSNSLCCVYNAQVNQIKPLLSTNVASTPFYIILTDRTEYQRTETVNIHASGYNFSESVSVTIRTQTNPVVVFSQTIPATTTGIVSANWKIPRNATIDSYVVSLTGTSTVKNPPDVQGFTVRAATMTVSSLTSIRSTYQRTETMKFSFQAAYPDGSLASTGAALLTLARPSGANVTLTTTYNNNTQSFEAKYKTSVSNQTGTWTATLGSNAYADGYGNTGPAAKLTNTPQLIPAVLNVNVNATIYVPIGRPVKFNATISYPDGASFQSGSGTVGAYLLYSGTPTVNDTVSVVFDSGLKFWVGSYTPRSSDPGGLWSLVVAASDSFSPPNGGSATKAVTLQDRPPIAGFTSTPSSAPTASPVSFDGTASYDPDGTVVTYAWAFGDGTTGSGPVVGHAYSIAGIYTVTLTVTDNGGITGSTSSTVTITDRPPAVSFTPSPSTANTGQTVTLSITSYDPDGTISNTKVDWGDGTIDSLTGAATSDTHTYASTGSLTSEIFTVTITVTDNSGSFSSVSSQVTINDRVPVVSFSPSSTSINTGQNVTLTISATDPDGTVTSRKVDWGDGSIDSLPGGATSDIHSYATTGTVTSKMFTIVVSATDNSGSVGSYSTQITVSDRAPVISFTVTPTSLSTGQTVSVSISSSDPDGTISSTKVDWGDGTIDTLTGAPTLDTHAYTTTGSASSKTYAITITVTDNSGSVKSSTSTVNVQGNPQSSGSVSFPLYYFGILAALIAAILAGGFLAFRRHRVTSAKLKIDLEAVRSEAGRIENQEFFQSVKDQLKKDKDD